jgi:hypothetical protein
LLPTAGLVVAFHREVAPLPERLVRPLVHNLYRNGDLHQPSGNVDSIALTALERDREVRLVSRDGSLDQRVGLGFARWPEAQPTLDCFPYRRQDLLAQRGLGREIVERKNRDRADFARQPPAGEPIAPRDSEAKDREDPRSQEDIPPWCCSR